MDNSMHSASFLVAHLFHKVCAAVLLLNSIEVKLGDGITSHPQGAADFREEIERIMKESFGGVPEDLQTYVALTNNICEEILSTLAFKTKMMLMMVNAKRDLSSDVNEDEIYVNGPRGSA